MDKAWNEERGQDISETADKLIAIFERNASSPESARDEIESALRGLLERVVNEVQTKMGLSPEKLLARVSDHSTRLEFESKRHFNEDTGEFEENWGTVAALSGEITKLAIQAEDEIRLGSINVDQLRIDKLSELADDLRKVAGRHYDRSAGEFKGRWGPVALAAREMKALIQSASQKLSSMQLQEQLRASSMRPKHMR